MSRDTIRLPHDAYRLLQTLRAAGHSAYVVGGCVRDSLLGRLPGDWDICTSARPDEMKALFCSQRLIYFVSVLCLLWSLQAVNLLLQTLICIRKRPRSAFHGLRCHLPICLLHKIFRRHACIQLRNHRRQTFHEVTGFL